MECLDISQIEGVTVLYDMNPDMVFNYVSGQGTDSSEKGRVTKLGQAMIHTLLHTPDSVHLENAGINQLAAL